MKILWISPTPSHPQNAGNRAHIHAMAEQVLAAGHHVTLLLYGQETVPDEAKQAMQSFWSDFVYVPHRLRERTKTHGDVWGIDDWYNADLEAAVRFLLGQNDYDAVYCEYVFFSKALTLFPESTLKILSCHDRMSNRAQLLQKQGIAPDFFYTTPEQEKIALDRADIVLAIQDEERAFFQSLTSKAVLEVGYPVEAVPLPAPVMTGKLRIGYLGSNNSLNRKSLLTFLGLVQNDGLLAQRIEVVAAGTICNSLANTPVVCLGEVAEEADFYRQVDLVINPMLDGTGLKIKTLSAIRHGMPFLSTATGSKGIAVSFAEHDAASVETLVEHVRALLDAPAQRLDALRAESVRLLAAYQSRQRQQVRDLLRAIETGSIAHIGAKRVLVVTDVPFWEAALGNHMRIFTMCKEIQRHAELTVFYFGSLFPEREAQIAAAGFAGQVISFKDYEQAAKDLRETSDFPRLPGLERWRHEIFFKSLRAFLSFAPQFDTVVFEYIWLAYTRAALPYQAITVLDTHDLMTMREYRFVSQGLRHHISLTFGEEMALLDRFDSVIAIQHEEAEILSSVLKKALPICCPHGVDMPECGPPRATADTLILGFVGGASDANFAAIDWFLRQVWPVMASLPIALHVYGAVCQRIDQAPPGVVLHGKVDRLDSAYAGCDVIINPMIHGGGIKIKSVEALAYGKPLVASPEGAVGIAAPADSGVFVARNRAEFIDALVRLLAFPEERRAMANAARQAAEAQFSSARCFAPLVELIQSV
ncbi:glycosyltransferase [Janthinobacterium sp. 17J80-10]|uniref:glycosyltransferase n=1 Tax=Janthinobacterium sp. 17J80-10 TaxID=2497863 RepID=UPI001005A4A1|nr:glycosyltransferase [Janthinobacterium sp. 17J80-10]QAU35546.1 glycosyltransferase [Janthinobacterium sp. 17J80-10]